MMFWRSLTQWLGGMGVITLFVAVLPRLAIGVRQLFFTESPGPTEEKLTPHIRETAAYLWRFYAGLTAIEMVALKVAGMPLFDAICHSMTTLAAWRLLAPRGIDSRIPQPGGGMDHLPVHVSGRSELRVAVPSTLRSARCSRARRRVQGVHDDRGLRRVGSCTHAVGEWRRGLGAPGGVPDAFRS